MVMQIITTLTSLPDTLKNGAISIGKFDGMHLGHASIVHRLKHHADHRQIPAICITFDPLPAAVLQPNAGLRPICSLERKIELVRQFQIDAIVIIPTTPEFLQQSSEMFFDEVICRLLQSKIVVAGRNFSFGRDRTGTAETIKHYALHAGIEIDIVEPLEIGGNRVSSSRIRKLIQEGQIEKANELMPTPYQMSGTVGIGEQRGRTMGFPTANLQDVQTILPKSGVYATETRIGTKNDVYASTTHVGSNMTFDGSVPTVETFIHDFEDNIYGEKISVDFLSYLRESTRFDSAESLARQMQKDVEQSRKR